MGELVDKNVLKEMRKKRREREAREAPAETAQPQQEQSIATPEDEAITEADVVSPAPSADVIRKTQALDTTNNVIKDIIDRKQHALHDMVEDPEASERFFAALKEFQEGLLIPGFINATKPTLREMQLPIRQALEIVRNEEGIALVVAEEEKVKPAPLLTRISGFFGMQPELETQAEAEDNYALFCRRMRTALNDARRGIDECLPVLPTQKNRVNLPRGL